MEDEKKLYPFKIAPLDDASGQTTLLADLGFPDSLVRNGWLSTNTISEIMDMYMDRVVGDDVFAYYGRQFPVLLRRLHCEARTPLMVHPDDRTAEERFDFLGKAKLWYVVSAEPGAKLFLGFKNDVASSDFYSACQDGSVEGLLNVVEPSAGDHFFIAPGTVHCAGKGLEIAEISESSPLDFRLFDWGRKGELDPFDAELSLEEAFDFIDYRAWKPADALAVRDDKGSLRLTDNKEFTAAEIRLSEALHVSCSDFGSFIAYLCISGEASIQIPADPESGRKDLETYVMGRDEVILVPAEVTDFFLVPRASDTVILETVMSPRSEEDSYGGKASEEEVADDGFDTADQAAAAKLFS